MIEGIPSHGSTEGFPIDQLDQALAALPQLSAEEALQFEADIAAVVGRLQPEGDTWAS